MPSRTLSTLRRLSAPDRFADALRVLVAMLGVALYSVVHDRPQTMIALLLGVIAAALAETGDDWRTRLQSLLVTLLCFSVAAFVVEWLFALPWAFAIALTLGSFLLVMLGAASPRYATIASATLLLAVYAMISADQHGAMQQPLWQEPLLLIIGAAWYGLLATIWSALFVQHPVRQSLSRLYDTLGDYMDTKAQLFEPVRDLPVATLQAQLAQSNTAVVDALNACRRSLINRLDRRRPQVALQRLLSLYLDAQDIHERAASSHYPYHALAEAFFHSDVLFRGQRLMRNLAQSCHAQAQAQRRNGVFAPDADADAALHDLRAAIDRHRAAAKPPALELLQTLDRLGDNLEHLKVRIHCTKPDGAANTDRSLHDPSPSGPGEVWQRIRTQLTPTSTRFRHALRLSLAMLTGYAVLRLVHPAEGYWILLTIMLVCQPSHGATRLRMWQRIGGTTVGLLAGWALLKLFPDPRVQLALMVTAGGLFFVARFRRYLIATAAVTVLVLLAFNQVGDGYQLIAPRLLDTLLGSAIAVAVTFLVMANWRERELRLLFATLLDTHAHYLQAIAEQYATGRHDDLAYRLARRNAHNANVEFSAHLTDALNDPAGQRADPESVLRLLAVTQQLLSHLSTLGAHRPSLPAQADRERQRQQAVAFAKQLQALAALLRAPNSQQAMNPSIAVETTDVTDNLTTEGDTGAHLINTQLRLLNAQFPALVGLCAKLQAGENRHTHPSQVPAKGG